MQQDKRAQLVRDGFCIAENVLEADMLARLRAVTDDLLAQQTEEARQRQRTTGSMISTMRDPLFADLVTYPRALAALRDLGCDAPTFTDGYIISKPPKGERLFWHYDWFAWEDARSYEPEPLQLFMMYYLVDTTRENGCLRVIPGSHASHNPLHDQLLEPHSPQLSQARDLSLPDFSDRPDEMDVPVRAGDAVIGDARLLHAAHTNQTDERRTLITLWYQADLAAMPERMQAQMAAKTHKIPADWPEDAVARLSPLLANQHYQGDAKPYGRSLYRPKPVEAGSA